MSLLKRARKILNRKITNDGKVYGKFYVDMEWNFNLLYVFTYVYTLIIDYFLISTREREKGNPIF